MHSACFSVQAVTMCAIPKQLHRVNSSFVYVTVTVYYPSSRIDHFTPLMILHFIQSNSTACSNSMNCNCTLI